MTKFPRTTWLQDTRRSRSNQLRNREYKIRRALERIYWAHVKARRVDVDALLADMSI